MKRTIQLLIAAAALSAGAVHAITVDASVDGPLLKQDRVIKYISDAVGGAVAKLPDVEAGGKYRLYARVTSQLVGPGSRFSCLVEIELQRQVIEQDTGFLYWVMTYSATAWGTVPSERELWQTITEMVQQKVNIWVPF